MDIIGIIIWDVNGWYPHHGMLVVTGDIYIC